jgi:hypothetical protein
VAIVHLCLRAPATTEADYSCERRARVVPAHRKKGASRSGFPAALTRARVCREYRIAEQADRV